MTSVFRFFYSLCHHLQHSWCISFFLKYFISCNAWNVTCHTKRTEKIRENWKPWLPFLAIWISQIFVQVLAMKNFIKTFEMHVQALEQAWNHLSMFCAQVNLELLCQQQHFEWKCGQSKSSQKPQLTLKEQSKAKVKSCYWREMFSNKELSNIWRPPRYLLLHKLA